MGDLRYRAATAADRAAVAGILTASWGGTTVVAHGVSRDALTLPALLAERDRPVLGVLTYALVDCELEVVSLDAVVRRAGVGSGLLRAAAELARDAGAR